ncbi:GNAT family N-acetyltransferase [Streptomyces sp. NPDC015125]|uniref:GNAT family N-acetyltransferase n=1 Tax=Streptomyces sp. NPDC015125 TaxID=3364938 RepID=UPI0036F9A81E
MPPAMDTEAIHTRRLTLLPLLADHAGELAAVLSDPALHTFTGGAPASPEALRTRHERLVAGSPDPAVTWCNWVIQLRDRGCLAGTVQATVTVDAHGSAAEVAWVVGTDWQRRGIATEAARGLVAWLRHRSVQTLIAHIHPDHHASAAVAAAAGFTPTGHEQDGETRWQRVPEVAGSRTAAGGAAGSGAAYDAVYAATSDAAGRRAR